jgi:competence protein ComEA
VYERLRELTKWWGVGRIATTAGGVLSVALGAWWVLRVPPPPPESAIVYATTSVLPVGASLGLGLPTNPDVIRVHVAGEVNHPGVYQLAGTARVVDAVDAAGGPTVFADVDVINLAASLFDAAQIFIPRRGSTGIRAPIPRPLPGVNAPAPPNNNTPTSGNNPRVNINTASIADLDTLSGVGPSTAQAIIDYRTKNGPFGSIDDLLNVRGIGPAKLDAIREQVTV